MNIIKRMIGFLWKLTPIGRKFEKFEMLETQQDFWLNEMERLVVEMRIARGRWKLDEVKLLREQYRLACHRLQMTNDELQAIK